MEFTLVDDGTLDTVLTCNECDEELRFNYAFVDGVAASFRVQQAIADAKLTHECGGEDA